MKPVPIAPLARAGRRSKYRRTRGDGSRFTTTPYGARRARNRRREALATQSRRKNRSTPR